MPFHFIQTHGYIRLNYFLIPTSLAHAFDLPDGNFFFCSLYSFLPGKINSGSITKIWIRF